MTNNEIAVVKQHEIGECITEKVILDYMDSFGLASQLNDNEKKQFINIAVMFRLNPFKREIYAVPYNTKDGRKLSIMTGYESYIKRAEQTGDLNGWDVVTKGKVSDKTLTAVITIHRKSWNNPFIHEVCISEYDMGNSMWRSKPITMLKKVAISQGFRLCFSDQVGGMPYSSEELPDNMTKCEATVVPEPNTSHIKPTIKPIESTIEHKPVESPVQDAVIADEPVQEQVQEPKDGAKIAIGFVAFHNLPKGASKYHSFVLRDYKGYYFNTKDNSVIETLHNALGGNEKVAFEYEETEWSANGKSGINRTILSLIDVQAE